MPKSLNSTNTTVRDITNVVFTPAFYQNFNCIGSSCENNCCQNWAITMDRPTYTRFKKHSDFKVRQVALEQTKSCGKDGFDYRSMKLTSSGNCPFLDEQRLCYVHKNHGEALLPTVCKVYPRENKVINGALYSSLSISCPEAARQILLNPSAMTIEQATVNRTTPLPEIAGFVHVADSALLDQFKQVAYQCLLAENSTTVEERLFNLAMLFSLASERINNGQALHSLLQTYGTNIASGEIKTLYDACAVADNVQLFAFEQFFYGTHSRMANVAFLSYKEQMINKLKLSSGYDPISNKIDLVDYYAKYCQSGYDKLIENNGYSLINLMLHWVFSKPFDLNNGQQLFGQFTAFVLKFFYIRMICGVLNDGQTKAAGHTIDRSDQPMTTDELIVGVVHSISRHIDHAENFSNKVYTRLVEQGLTAPEHIFGLIKI